MDNLKEKLDTLIAQHQQVAQQANDALTMKTKLEGAIELVQQLMQEENSKDGQAEKTKKEKAK